MSQATHTLMIDRPQLSLADRAATLCAWALAVALFLTVGWDAMAPDDPLGAVSVFGRHGGWMMIVQSAAIAAVASGLASVIAGRKLTDVGTFAVALGVAMVALRGSTAESLLVAGADATGSGERRLAISFVIETLGWSLVIAVSLLAAAAVMRWCFGWPERADTDGCNLVRIASRSLAGYDTPVPALRRLGLACETSTPRLDGARHVAIATIVGLAVITLLSLSLSNRSIQHGQVCFVVAAGVAVATDVASRFVPVRSTLWSILAVFVMAILGYLWSAVRPASAVLLPNVPVSQFMRILPIQFIAVGTATAIMTFWYVHPPEVLASRGVDRKKGEVAREDEC